MFVVNSKLELVKELGATHTINGKESSDVVAEIIAITNGGANYSVDTTGASSIINQALQCLRTEGVCGTVGVTGDVAFNLFNTITLEGRTLKGFIEGNSVPQLFIPKLVAYYKAGLFPIEKLVKTYDLEQINEAFEDQRKGVA